MSAALSDLVAVERSGTLYKAPLSQVAALASPPGTAVGDVLIWNGSAYVAGQPATSRGIGLNLAMQNNQFSL